MQDFETKRKNLFDLLGNEEKKLKGSILEQKSYSKDEVITKNSPKLRRKDNANVGSAERLIGKESIFKKPDLPIQKCLKPRSTPDYKINPQKWTKYTLEDADISDKANTSAAFAFLQEIEKRKEMEEYKLVDDNVENSVKSNDIETEKIIFNKTASLKRSIKTSNTELDDVEVQTPKFKSSAIVMPEYVVGQKPTKEKKTRVDTKKTETKGKKNQELKLSHLLEYDDDDEGSVGD